MNHTMQFTHNLTPMQKGMLFNCLASPRSGTDVEQVIGALQEAVNPDAFRSAWQRLVERHEALRMQFFLDEQGNARQCPRDRSILSIDEYNWLNLSAKEQERQLETFLANDRARGFDPRVDMPVRVALFNLGETDYRFVFTWWHGILDGWARQILLQELFRFYDAFRQGKDLVIPSPRPYTDYTNWLVAQDMAGADSYWKDLLDGFTHPTPLASHRFSSDEGEGCGQREIRLSRAETLQLQTFAQTQGITFNTLVQGAWALVLSLYSGEMDVVFGATRRCRRSAFNSDGSGEEIVGCLINTVPVRVKIPPEERVIDWLKELRTQHMAVRPFENSPLTAIQACSGVPADQRLFDSIVVYEKQLLDTALRTFGNWTTRRFETRGQTGLPLMVYAFGEPQLLLGIQNVRAQLDDSAAERMLACLITALQSLAEHPQEALGNLPLLPEKERRLLLDEWNCTECHFPDNCTIQDYFEEQVTRTPDAAALTCFDKTWTYRELDRRAEEIARQLQKAGARPETIIGICMERSLDLVAGMLGILKAGAAYLPLDHTYPAERLHLMVEDAKPLLVVSNQATRNKLPATDTPIFLVDDGGLPGETDVSPSRKGERAGGHNIAYLIYTSGSTGRPKGVMVEHRNIMNLFVGVDAILGREPGVFLAVTSISFDPSVVDLFWALTRGYHVVIWPGMGEAKSMSIPELIRQYGVTDIGSVPSFIQMVLMQPDGREALASLRRIQVGGEPLPLQLLEDLGPSISRRLVNAYGPTEATVLSTAWHVEPNARTTPIGRPIANTRIYVLDRNRRPVPVGVVGELYIGGAGVARGYFNQPELTAEKFVADPFDQKEGGRLYRTGDLVLYRPDGMLEFVGRIDHQVKIRGYRVELGEIEIVLGKHPDLREVVVHIQHSASGGNQLVAYTVPGPKGMPTTKKLREWVGRELPAHMVPTAFMALDEIPRTANGKVDRKSLPPLPTGTTSSGEARPPTPLEANLMEIWCKVLHREQVGLEENFFDLGGDSLLAVAMSVAIEERLGIKIPIKDVFGAPTVASLAAEMVAYAENDEAAPISSARRVTTAPASFGQEALWIHTRLNPGSPVYNVPVGLRLRGPLNLSVLQTALDLLERHEALRTTFAIINGVLCQVIADRGAIPLQRVGVQDASENDRLRQAEALALEEARRPFDLERGPLIRATLVGLGPTDHMLVLVLHHIICDGRSITILLRELGSLYSAGLAGQPASLSPLPIQYADFVMWQREHLTESRLAPHLDFWKQQLADAPPLLNLPTDHSRPATQSYRGAHIPIFFEREFVERLRAFSRRCGCTLFMTLMAGLQTLLARHLPPEERDVIVGFPVAGRTRRETEEIVGFFVNTLVLRTDLADAPTFRELLSRVRHTAVSAYAHQELPFDRLVAALNPERSLSHTPVYQVVLALHEDVAEVPLSGLDTSVVSLNSGTTKFDLTLALDANCEGGLTGYIEYATDLFDQRTVERMAEHYRQLLESAEQEPDQKVDQIPLLSEPELHQLITEWNQTDCPFPEESSIQRCFEEQVARTPDAPAVTCYNKTWTYSELDRRAEEISCRLRKAGAGPETVVGICMERCLDLVAGILGILKTGATFLPLDPTYPPDRLSFMIEDTKPLLVVSNSTNSELIPVTDAPVFSVDDDTVMSGIDNLSGHKEVRDGGHNLAYIIYTSGSTGKPKGVLVEHRNVMNYFTGMDSLVDREPGVFLAVSSVSFDASVIDLWWPLTRGYQVILLAGAGKSDTSSIPELILRHGVTHIFAVPSLLRLVMTLPRGVEALESMRRILTGGEALSSILLQDLGPSITQQMFNVYGPTETTVIVTAWRIEPGAERILIGRPLANTKVFILDRHRHPVPVGVVGELCIGGAGVTRGYLNRPELTDEKFIPNPFDQKASGRLYRTGDLARYKSDGMIEFVGRIDNQVKIRGFRVELGEIEAVLSRHPDIREAVIDFQEAKEGHKQLVAYYVPEPKRMPPIIELREWLGRELPVYMVPAAFVALEAIPLTSNGKLDRRALPSPTESAPPSGKAGRIPTPIETKLTEIWCEVLHRKQVGLDENFFDLGGDSLMAVVMIVAIEERFNVKFRLEAMLNSQTVESMADQLAGLIEPERKDLAGAQTGSASHDGPRTATERRLHAIWERLLETRPIGVHDSFFKLYDNSALFDQMLVEVRKTFEVFSEGLPLHAVRKNPTIESLARMIDESIKPTQSLLVRLQPHGAKSPLFLIHAGGGYVFFYRALAARLGPDLPVYAVRAETSSDGMGHPFQQSKSVGEVASRYLTEIKRVQPRGPYSLGGACVGGVIVLEMARQLQDEGEELAGPLLLFDSFVLNNPRLPREQETSILGQAGFYQSAPFGDRLTRHLARISQMGLMPGIRYVSSIVLRNAPALAVMPIRAAVRKLTGQKTAAVSAKAAEIVEPINTVEAMQRAVMKEFMSTSSRLMSKYIPRVIEGSIVLFASTGNCNPEPLWTGLARGGLVVHEMPGVHLEMMEEPAVMEVAALVLQYLDSAETHKKVRRSEASLTKNEQSVEGLGGIVISTPPEHQN